MNFLTVLPLTFVMIAGPQIISAILLATGLDARRNSLAFLARAALAVTVGTMVAYWATGLLERAAGPSGEGTVKTVIDWLVIALFLFLMVRTYRGRKDTPRPGGWAGCRPPTRASRSGWACCCWSSVLYGPVGSGQVRRRFCSVRSTSVLYGLVEGRRE